MANGVKNGAFAIIRNPEKKILMVRRRSSGLWELPGGTVERGELPSHAAQEETEEESGAIVDAVRFVLVGQFVQRPSGLVSLYEDPKPYTGKIQLNFRNHEEVSAAAFRSFELILKQPGKVGTGALRMILRWKRCELGIDALPYEGRLSDKVEFPRNLIGGRKEFEKLILAA